MNVPEPGFYYHYKHDPAVWDDHAYEVVGLARNTEEKTYTVLYRPLYANDWFAPAMYQSRPLEMFMENVEWEGKVVPRFVKIADQELISKLKEAKSRMYS